MCGIAGFVDPGGVYEPEDWGRVVSAMAAPMRHRGPDDAGTWYDRQRESHWPTGAVPSSIPLPQAISPWCPPAAGWC